ncbi:MAG: hypothetical protein R6V58_12930 [Planctomycetota bacterium]
MCVLVEKLLPELESAADRARFLLELAEARKRLKEPGEAAELREKAKKELARAETGMDELASPAAKAERLIGLAGIRKELGETAVAKKNCAGALAHVRQLDSAAERLPILRQLILAERALKHSEGLLAACVALETAALGLQAPAQQVSVLLEAAGHYRRAKKPNRVTACCKKIEERLALLESADGKLDACFRLIDLYAEAGQGDAVLRIAADAQRLAAKAGASKRLFRVATIYRKRQQKARLNACCKQIEENVADLPEGAERLPLLLRLVDLYAAAENDAGALRIASAAEEAAKAAGDAEAQRKSLLTKARILEESGEYDDAARVYRRCGSLDHQWLTYARGALCLARSGEVKEALATLTRATREHPGSAPGYGSKAGSEAADYFRSLNQTATRIAKKGHFEAAIRLWRTATCLVGRNARNMKQVSDAQGKIVNLLMLVGKTDEAISEAKRSFRIASIERMDPGVDLVARAFKAADRDINKRVKPFLDFQKYGPAGPDEQRGTEDDLSNLLSEIEVPAAKEYELLDVLTATLDVTDHRGHGYVLLLKGDAKGALAEFRCGHAVAQGDAFSQTIYDVATAIKAIDGHVMRANAYLRFQNTGPAGKDGTPGTQDDLAAPLADVPLELPAERVAAIEKEMERCELNYEGLRRRAYLLLSAGRCREGLDLMRRAYGLSDVDAKSLQRAISDVAVAIKAVDGHIFRANRYLVYQKYGKAGPDKTVGTEDDLTDPLAEPEAGEVDPDEE